MQQTVWMSNWLTDTHLVSQDKLVLLEAASFRQLEISLTIAIAVAIVVVSVIVGQLASSSGIIFWSCQMKQQNGNNLQRKRTILHQQE